MSDRTPDACDLLIEAGFVVPVGRPDLFAARLLELLEAPERAAAMGQQARSHVLALYDDKRLLAGFRELWQYTAAQVRSCAIGRA